MKQVTIKSYDDLPLTFDVKKLQEVLGIGRKRAYELIHEKGFPKMRIGRSIIVPKQGFINWLEAGGRVVTDETNKKRKN